VQLRANDFRRKTFPRVPGNSLPRVQVKGVEHLIESPEQSISVLGCHEDANAFDNELLGSPAACGKDRSAASHRFRSRHRERFYEAGKHEQIGPLHEFRHFAPGSRAMEDNRLAKAQVLGQMLILDPLLSLSNDIHLPVRTLGAQPGSGVEEIRRTFDRRQITYKQDSLCLVVAPHVL
jgi:hypothetical protein